MSFHARFLASVSAALVVAPAALHAQTVTRQSLLAEMTDPAAVARLPLPRYESLQASSYNRASTNRNQPNQDTSGWFADSDGLGFIRTETTQGRQEWVIMEHQGPGCLTKLWTPFFYHGFHDRGFEIRMVFDSDPAKIGQPLADFTVGDMEVMAEKVHAAKIRIAMLAVPATAAQKVADLLVKAGVKAILNYAPTSLAVPKGVTVQNIDPAAHMQHMTYYLEP